MHFIIFWEMTKLKTFTPRPTDIHRKWYLVDAKNQVLGRLASQVAYVLRGKHKPIFAPHVDVGDHVVIINAEKIRITGKKSTAKRYRRYTGYPGGFREMGYQTMLEKYPEKILEHAIRGMLPHNRLGRQMLKKVRIYVGEKHPHQAQKTEPLPLR